MLHMLPFCEDAESIARGFSRMHKRNIRKAHQSGVTIERASTLGPCVPSMTYTFSPVDGRPSPVPSFCTTITL